MNILAALFILPYAGLFAWLLVHHTEQRIRGHVAIEAQARHLKQARRIRRAWVRRSRKAIAKKTTYQQYPVHAVVFGRREGVEL